ncbi:hypothetical protein K439DRAFT_1617126 [Ramaria rubella]|nr:hypothetical protein K439DRAFT_1617126 [Ramaria rubella]
MVYLVPVIALVTSLAVFAVPHVNVKRTASKMETDLATIHTDLDALNDAVTSIPASGVTLPVATNLLNLGYSLNEYVVNNAETSESLESVDAASLQSSFQQLQTSTINTLGNLKSQKTALEGVLPGSVGSTIVNQLITASLSALNVLLNAAAPTSVVGILFTIAFSLALMLRVQISSRDTSDSIKTAFDKAFESAIATFSAN